MKSLKNIIPNTLTCCNFLCGCMAVIITCSAEATPITHGHLAGQLLYALCLIILGAVFDFLDGMTARALHVDNPLGKELDSLADATTFGLAPTVMVFKYVQLTTQSNAAYIVLIMAAFSIIRLAKFNLDTRQKTSFIGLATPANALFWASLATFLTDNFYSETLSTEPLNVATGWIIIICTLMSSYMLISEIPFFSLKFHDLKWENNKTRYIFIIGSALILTISIILSFITDYYTMLPIGSISFIIIYYIILALIDDIKKLKRA